MTRFVKWYVGPVGFDVLKDALTHRRHFGGVVSLMYTDTDRAVKRQETTVPKGARKTESEAAREVEDLLRSSLVANGFTPHQADAAIAEAKRKREARKVRKVRKVRQSAKSA